MLTKNIDVLRHEAEVDPSAGGKGGFIDYMTPSYYPDPDPASERFGLPITVLGIAKNIFKDLPEEDGKAFLAAFPDAVGRNGKDLSRVHWAFLAAELRALPEVSPEIQAVVDPVIAGMDLLAAGKEWPDANPGNLPVHLALADMLRSAERWPEAAAAYAAFAAPYATHAAPYAAYAAAQAAYAATYASDTPASARIRQRDTLLALIAAA